jgi:hypothetical protein
MPCPLRLTGNRRVAPFGIPRLPVDNLELRATCRLGLQFLQNALEKTLDEGVDGGFK